MQIGKTLKEIVDEQYTRNSRYRKLLEELHRRFPIEDGFGEPVCASQYTNLNTVFRTENYKYEYEILVSQTMKILEVYKFLKTK